MDPVVVDGPYDPVPDLAAVLAELQNGRILHGDGLRAYDRLWAAMGMTGYHSPADFEEGLRRLLAPPQPEPVPEPETCPGCHEPRKQGRIAHKLSCPAIWQVT